MGPSGTPWTEQDLDGSTATREKEPRFLKPWIPVSALSCLCLNPYVRDTWTSVLLNMSSVVKDTLTTHTHLLRCFNPLLR